jgi:hypothetical protein
MHKQTLRSPLVKVPCVKNNARFGAGPRRNRLLYMLRVFPNFAYATKSCVIHNKFPVLCRPQYIESGRGARLFVICGVSVNT